MSVVDESQTPFFAVGAAIFLGAAGLLVGVAFGLITLSFLGAFLTIEQGSPLTNAVGLIAQGAGLLAVGVAYLTFRELPLSYLRLEWPSLRDVGWVLAASVTLFAVLAALTILIEQLGLSATEHSTARAAKDNPELLLPLIPLSVLVTGPAEEFLYRGVIQTRLKESFDLRVAVAVAAVIFSIVHVPAYAAGSGLGPSLVTTLVVLLVLGSILGAVYEYADNLVVPAVAHGIYNAVVFGQLYVETAGLF